MSERLPDFLNVSRLARQGVAFKGRVPIARLARLASILADADGEAEAELAFSMDDQGIPVVRGRVTAPVALTCQRCLEPMEQVLASRFVLGAVASEAEAERLPEEYEPLLVSGDRVATADLLEDELILAVPIVPMHEPERCTATKAVAAVEGKPGPAAGNREAAHPFAVLDELKRKQ
ncbi:MAG: YceD family protein [Gammaproteobacteria bacterium]